MEPNQRPASVSSFQNRNYRLYYSILFICFGILITILTALVTYKIRIMDIQSELEQNAAIELNRKQEELTGFITGFHEYISALRSSPALKHFIREPNPVNRRYATGLFTILAKTTPSIMQIRYLDQTGFERIRVDQDVAQNNPIVIDQSKLQDKSQRYYFSETAQFAPNSFWISKLDLNIENRRVEVPYKPVVRIASPIYIDQRFSGIIILNIRVKGFLNTFMQSNYFNISLVDKEGYYIIHHPNDEFSWSRYLQTGHTLQTTMPDLAYSILTGAVLSKPQKFGEVYAASIASILPRDGAIVIFEPKLEKLKQLQEQRKKAITFIVTLIFILSLPISYFIARAPARLSQQIIEQNEKLNEYFELIDTSIPTCTIDINGKFLSASTAFANKLGILKHDLIGTYFTELSFGQHSAGIGEQILESITEGKSWKGEIEFRTTSGTSYWTFTRAHPKRNEQDRVVACSIIHRNISHQKRIEEISITDDLTGLYNRRFFNETITKELKRAQRDEKQFSFAMADVDYFKQYNDHYGHQKGDEVLKAISRTLRTKLARASDSCYRLGGEEFGIIFTDSEPDEAWEFVDRIRKDIQELGIEHRWSMVAEVVTISIGLLSVSPGPGRSVDEIYRKADEALYNAKHNGRNRVTQSMLQ